MASFELTKKQVEANVLLGSPAAHTMLYGGSRSGKTFVIVRAILTRGLAYKSRHAVLRYRFNHLKGSVIYDTLPKVMGLCFPGVADHCHMDKSDWFYSLPNGSEIWFGGLDDKERTEKILGQEYCVDPAARVLTADLRWVPAKDLVIGQELIGFPEGLNGHCKLQSSFVQRSDVIQAERYRVTTDKGETIVSSRHQFVAHHDDRRHRNYRQFSWRMASQLKVGDRIRWTCDIWEVGETKEDGWFSGMLDGEGWCSRPARQVGVAQCRNSCLDALREWLRRNAIKYLENESGGVVGKKGPCIQLKACGLWPSLRLLGIARPKRLDARKIWDGCRSFRNAGHDATITKIESLGIGPVVALGTSSKTFIADGFLGHNSSMFLNECSQIPWPSRNIAMTRLAQKTQLRLKAYYDCNPPNDAHWTRRVFVDKSDPDTRTALKEPGNYASMLMNPEDNAENLPAGYIKELENLPERMRRRFLLGQFGTIHSGALWTLESLDIGRVLDGSLPDMQRIVIAIDPSGCSGPEDKRSDEVGIIVAGLGADGRAYVLEDLSGRFGPHQWGAIAASAFDRHQADVVVGETNYGGAMVAEVIKVARPRTPFKSVTGSRGKVVRAEPIAALYGVGDKVGKVSHVGFFPQLEDQMCGFTTAGYLGERSPDRADALVWALTELFPALSRPERKVALPPVEHTSFGQGQGWMR